MVGMTELSVDVQLAGGIRRIEHALARHPALTGDLNQLIYPVNVPPMQITSTGVLDLPDMLGPKLGKWWEIWYVSAQGYTGGTVDCYRNSQLGELLFTFSQAGIWEPSHRYLQGGSDRMVFTASGLTGSASITFGAVEIDATVLGLHLL
jgi:hypothetical protein